MDALTVAVDKLHRAVNDRPDLGKANVTKRVVLISNFLDAAKEDPDDQFGSVLVDRMQDKGIRMEVQLPTNHTESDLCTVMTTSTPYSCGQACMQVLVYLFWLWWPPRSIQTGCNSCFVHHWQTW